MVSKKPNEVPGKTTHYWVLNFQEQERELIKRRCWFKPAIKLIKVILLFVFRFPIS